MIFSGIGMARIVYVTKPLNKDPWIVPLGASLVLGGAMSGAFTAVSRNGTMACDRWIGHLANRSRRSLRHL